jgi:ABC-type transport system involved in cytochrome c biogenesis permease subunit
MRICQAGIAWAFVAVALPLTGCGAKPSNDAPSVKVDVSTAREIPVFHHGRVMPLDSLAKVALDTVCGSSVVKLGLAGYYTPEQLEKDAALKPALEMFPQGELRRMHPVEVLLSWQIEPEKWEDVPFILCQHGDLHKVLDVKSTTDTGLHRKFVSPRMIADSEALLDRFADIHDRDEAATTAGRQFKPNSTDEQVVELVNRYRVYRKLSQDPRLPLNTSPMILPGNRDEFLQQLMAAINLMEREKLQDLLVDFLKLFEGNELAMPVAQAGQAELDALYDLRELAARMTQKEEAADQVPNPNTDEKEDEPETRGPPTLKEAEAAVVNFRRATANMDQMFARIKDRAFDETSFSDSRMDKFRVMFRELASKSKDMNQLARQMHLALYDNGAQFNDRQEFQYGATVYVVPALNAAALTKTRDPKNQAEPWLSLATVLYGSDELLYHEDWPNENYSKEQIDAVRGAWKQLADSYANRKSENRADAFAAAQGRLVTTLRRLGEGIEAQRVKLVAAELPASQRDEKMIAYTKYPTAQRLAPELTYNRIKPFQWSWVICFLAVLAFGFSHLTPEFVGARLFGWLPAGKLRHILFWVAIAMLLATIIWTAYGFYLRILVTGWAPVTNMYETVVFVPWVIAALAIWFVLLPLTWTGISDAWRLTAVPGTWEATPLDKRRLQMMSPMAWALPGYSLAPLRVALMGAVFYYLAIALYNDGNRPVFYVWRRPEGGVTDSVGWLIAWGSLLVLVWFGPRVLLTLIGSLIFVPWSWVKDRGWQFMLPNVYPRWAFGVCGAAVATFLLLIAAYTPLNLPKAIDDDFKPLQPVLRSNFWLTIHVLTIVASYGAGLLAWGLGLLGLTHYLFGKYRDPVIATNVPKGMQPAGGDHSPARMGRLPPEECATLANYAYRAVQVAVLLLAAGTILGGLWADVSWGRFWGWDPKEVWALISLLVYLAILHGRYAGWFNNFGMIAGTILGAVMIAGSWYGVNFLLPLIAPDGNAGLHSYGTGAGGQTYVLSFLVLNLLYLIAAGLRYQQQTHSSVVPIEHTPEIVAPEIIRSEPRAT